MKLLYILWMKKMDSTIMDSKMDFVTNCMSKHSFPFPQMQFSLVIVERIELSDPDPRILHLSTVTNPDSSLRRAWIVSSKIFRIRKIFRKIFSNRKASVLPPPHLRELLTVFSGTFYILKVFWKGNWANIKHCDTGIAMNINYVASEPNFKTWISIANSQWNHFRPNTYKTTQF